MTKLIEAAAMLLGGLSLFAVSFVGFSVVSGTPLRDVAVVGKLLDHEPLEEAPAGAAALETLPASRRTERQVIESSLGTLGTWSLPAPFTQEELRALADELQARLKTLDVRETQLDQRERDLESRDGEIAERYSTLEDMRKDLEAFKAELILREQEVRRDEGAREERESARWSGVARVIAGLEDEAAGRRLAAYGPEEAASILLAMDEARATEVLNQLEGERWKAFVNAYTEARARAGVPAGKR